MLSANPKSVVMLGATGAVGGQVVNTLLKSPAVNRLSLLGRRAMPNIDGENVEQHIVDILDANSYAGLLEGHDVAICTLGVGEPSKVSKEEFRRIDHDAVIDFARCCKASGVEHFELLSSIGVSADSSNFFLRSKGELERSLEQLNFARLSLFHPSMILTPENRYGISQALTLKFWPALTPLLQGPLRKARGIKVEDLGHAMAVNIFTEKAGVETLEWDEIGSLAALNVDSAEV